MYVFKMTKRDICYIYHYLTDSVTHSYTNSFAHQPSNHIF